MIGSVSPVEPFDFGADFQTKILAALLRDPWLLQKYRHMLKAAYFSDSTLRQLADWLLSYYDAYSHKPTKPTMRQMVQAYCQNQPALAPHVDTFLTWTELLYSLELSDVQYVKEQLHGFVEEREYMLAIKKAIPKVGDPKLRKEIVNDVLSAQANLAKTHGSLGVSTIGMSAAERTAYLFTDEVRDCILSLWPSFNAFCGGYARSEMTCFAGSPNRGKSWALAHAAVSALLAGKKVVLYSLEMSEKLVELRIYSIMTGMSESELKMNPQSLEFAVEHVRNLGGELIVKQFFGAELKDIREHLMGVQSTFGWTPDMIVVDYADLLTSKDIEVDHQVLRTIYKGLRDIAVQYNAAMVTASQLNRGADKKEKPTMGDLAECYEKGAIVDVMWMLCQTEEEEITGRMRLYNVKNRNMARGKVIPLQLQLSKGVLTDAAPIAAAPPTGTVVVGPQFGGPTGPPQPMPFGVKL